jgi:hypothetical protein
MAEEIICNSYSWFCFLPYSCVYVITRIRNVSCLYLLIQLLYIFISSISQNILLHRELILFNWCLNVPFCNEILTCLSVYHHICFNTNYWHLIIVNKINLMYVENELFISLFTLASDIWAVHSVSNVFLSIMYCIKCESEYYFMYFSNWKTPEVLWIESVKNLHIAFFRDEQGITKLSVKHE